MEFSHVWERVGQAQQIEGLTLCRLAPLSLGEIGDAPKLAELPKPPGTAPGTRLEDFSWEGGGLYRKTARPQERT